MLREQAFEELTGRVSNKNLIKHSLAVEAIMRELAVHFKEEPDLWGIAGLMHDIDLEKVNDDMTKHSLVGADILEDLGFESHIVYAVRAHNPLHGIKRRRKIDKALYCSDPVSTLIIEGTLMLPSKKLNDVTFEYLLNRFNEKEFAQSVDRDQIKTCTDLGLSFDAFLNISLTALSNISNVLEL